MFSLARSFVSGVFVPSNIQWWPFLLHLTPLYHGFPSCYEHVLTFIVLVILIQIQYNSNRVFIVTRLPAACIFVPSNLQWALCVLAALCWLLPYVSASLPNNYTIYCVCIVISNTVQFKLCTFHNAFAHCMCFCTVKHTVVPILAALDFTLLYLPVMLSTSLKILWVCIITTDTIQF